MIFPNARIRRLRLYIIFFPLIAFLFVIVLSIHFSFLWYRFLVPSFQKKNKSFVQVSCTTNQKKYIYWYRFLVPCNYIIAKHLSFCKHYFNAFSLILKAFLIFFEYKKKRGYSLQIPSFLNQYFYQFYL